MASGGSGAAQAPPPPYPRSSDPRPSGAKGYGTPQQRLHMSSDAPAAASLPWVEKYRPSSLSDLVAHDEIVNTINRLIEANRLPHLLFYGPPGTGKTSTILACAKQLYGPQYSAMTLELNASDARGIDVVRQQITSFAGTKKLFSTGVKLIILDEADAMSSDAQFALRRVIEKYTKNTRFCLICNYVSKIIPALQSRCTRFRFAPLQQHQIEDRLQHVIDSEKVNVTPDGFRAVLELSRGDMRKVLNVLQSTAMANDVVDETSVYMCTGEPLPADIKDIVTALMNASFEEAYDLIAGLQRDKGLAVGDILTQVFNTISTMDLPTNVLSLLLRLMSDIEYRLASGVGDKLQLGALVGAFSRARGMMTALAAH